MAAKVKPKTVLEPSGFILYAYGPLMSGSEQSDSLYWVMRPVPAVLDAIDQDAVSAYQPYWAVRAHLRQHLGKGPEARQAYDRANGLAEDPAAREFLLQKRGLIFSLDPVEITAPHPSPL